MRDVPLAMVRDDMANLPVYSCPDGHRIHSYEDGDEEDWARIEAAAGPFPDESWARAHFAGEFAPVRERLPGRMLFLEHEASGLIGTITAWDGHLAGVFRGRIHWVEIVPAYQGRGLAKPLLSAAMVRLAEEHDAAYLTTETTSYRGINLYLGFGFEPWVESDLDREGWRIVEAILGERIL